MTKITRLFRNTLTSRVRVVQSNICPKTGEVFASKTNQSHLEACDINNIYEHFARTGMMPTPEKQAQYGDVSGLNQPLGDLLNIHKDTDQKLKAKLKSFRKSIAVPPGAAVGKPNTTSAPATANSTGGGSQSSAPSKS